MISAMFVADCLDWIAVSGHDMIHTPYDMLQ